MGRPVREGIFVPTCPVYRSQAIFQRLYNMKATNDTIDSIGHDQYQPPPFERFPFRAPEEAVLRQNVPPRGRGNPAYEACEGPRNKEATDSLITKDNPDPLPEDVRDRPAEERKEFVDEALLPLFPLKRHLALEDLLNRSQRNSYVGRNPATDGFMEKSVREARSIGAVVSRSGSGPVGTGCLIGPPGLGKTESLKRLLRYGFPQVVNIREYKGRKVAIQMLLWMYLSCPHKASVKGLIEWIAAVLDYIFGTDVLRRVIRAKNDSERQKLIAGELSLHVTGVLVIDEIQNINVGNADARKGFVTFLQELINTTRTRLILVGTTEVYDTINSDAMLRRMNGESGALHWGPLAFDDEWQQYLPELWKWQVTKTPTILTEDLSATMHRLTGGTPGYAVNLWTKAQSLLVGNSHQPDEKITKAVLQHTMNRYFSTTLQIVKRQRKKHVPSSSSSKNDSAGGAGSTKRAPDQGNASPVPLPPERPPEIPEGQQPVGFNINSVLPLS